MKLIVLNAAVDTLEFSYKEVEDPDLFTDLERLKILAKNQGVEVPLKIGKEELLVKDHGRRKFRYELRHRDFILNASPSSQLPNLKFKVFAETLHQYGHEIAFEKIDKLAKKLKTFDVAKISRIDLCVDYQGFHISKDRIDDFICLAKSDGIERINKKESGFKFGYGGNIVARIYDKTKEIDKSKKVWMYDIWNMNKQFKVDLPVWRLEFQFKRAALREFEIDTVNDGFSKLAGLWEYATDKWLSLRSGTESRVERKPVDESWLMLKNAVFPGKGCKRMKRGPGAPDEKQALQQSKAWIERIAAIWGIKSIDKVYMKLKKLHQSEVDRRDITFEELINARIETYNYYDHINSNALNQSIKMSRNKR